MRIWWLALCLGGCSGQVIVLGDSNSCIRPLGCTAASENTSWPLYITQHPAWPGWTVVNRALPSLTAGRFPGALPNGEPADGMWHLERVIREDLATACPTILPSWRRARRKLVLALGSNDVTQEGVTPTQAGAALIALYERARRVPCVDVYVATIPPRLDTVHASIMATNALIALAVPKDRLIPFGAQPRSDLENLVHMGYEGQVHRAAMAMPVLFPPAH